MRGFTILSLGMTLVCLFCIATYTAIVHRAPPSNWVCSLLVVSAGPLCVASFPSLRRYSVGLPFLALYGFTYFAASLTGQEVVALGSMAFQWVVVILGGLGSVWALHRSLEQPESKKKVVWILLAIGIGLLTAFFSSAQGGAGKFMFFLQHVLGLDLEAATIVNFLVRKGLHLAVYALLAISAAMVARGKEVRLVPFLATGYAWALPHAVLDEMTQTGSSVRTGSAWDVVLDAVGITIGLFLTHGILKRRSRKAI